MPSEVIDTNVLRVASVLESPQFIETPVSDPRVLRRVYDWLKEFRRDRGRHLVMDYDRTIFAEYDRNLPKESYGRRVLIEKFSTGSIDYAHLEYWYNGAEKVACLPAHSTDVEIFFHDLGDRKIVAAAHNKNAPIINATDGDWTEEMVEQGLTALGVKVVQLLTDDERLALRERQ